MLRANVSSGSSSMLMLPWITVTTLSPGMTDPCGKGKRTLTSMWSPQMKIWILKRLFASIDWALIVFVN